ncbi:MAG TPA: hypothetical protein VIR31_05800 [Nitrososphaeraceae archaeon]
MSYEDENKQSLFNAGVAQAQRIDSLQRAINSARFNPQQINSETLTLNYQVLISSLDGLLKEAWSKLTDPERKELLKLNNLLKSMQETYPPIERIEVEGDETTSLNYSNYTRLLKIIDIYERKVKDALDAHGLNSPNKDDDDDGL